MLTGYTANLPADVLLDSGVLYHEVAGVLTKIGVTMGAPSFDPGVELSDIEFDGSRMRYKGLTRRTGFKPVLKGQLKELGPAASGGQIALLEPGSSETTATGVTTVTPKAAGGLHASGDYMTDLRLIFERGSGGYAAIHFPIALCTKYSAKGQDKKEALIDFEFEAVGDPSGDLAAAPYAIEIRTALPA